MEVEILGVVVEVWGLEARWKLTSGRPWRSQAFEDYKLWPGMKRRKPTAYSRTFVVHCYSHKDGRSSQRKLSPLESASGLPESIRRLLLLASGLICVL